MPLANGFANERRPPPGRPGLTQSPAVVARSSVLAGTRSRAIIQPTVHRGRAPDWPLAAGHAPVEAEGTRMFHRPVSVGVRRPVPYPRRAVSMTAEKYRLVTRSDFDGLVCAVLLRSLDLIDDITFVHPKDVQDGVVEVTDRDILTNLPYARGRAHRLRPPPQRDAAQRRTARQPRDRRRGAVGGPRGLRLLRRAPSVFPTISDGADAGRRPGRLGAVRPGRHPRTRPAGRC